MCGPWCPTFGPGQRVPCAGAHHSIWSKAPSPLKADHGRMGLRSETAVNMHRVSDKFQRALECRNVRISPRRWLTPEQLDPIRRPGPAVESDRRCRTHDPVDRQSVGLLKSPDSRFGFPPEYSVGMEAESVRLKQSLEAQDPLVSSQNGVSV